MSTLQSLPVLPSAAAPPVGDPVVDGLALVPLGLLVLALTAGLAAECSLRGMHRRVADRLRRLEGRLRHGTIEPKHP